MNKINIKYRTTITYLTFLIGFAVVLYCVITKNIIFGFLALIGMFIMMFLIWAIPVICCKAQGKKVGFFSLTNSQEHSFQETIRRNNEINNDKLREYNTDIINNPAFNNLSCNIFHRHK